MADLLVQRWNRCHHNPLNQALQVLYFSAEKCANSKYAQISHICAKMQICASEKVAHGHWPSLVHDHTGCICLTFLQASTFCHLDKIQPTMGKVPSAHKGTMNGSDVESIPIKMLPGVTHLAREGRPAHIYIRYNPPFGRKLHKYEQ